MVVLNGVDKDALDETVHAIDQDPAKGLFHFESSTQWKGGAKVETKFAEDGAFTWNGDEPPQLLGTGTSLGPSDSLLHAMSHCLLVTTAYHAAARDISIDDMKVQATGYLNLQGFCDANPKVRPGFKEIHLQLCVDSPAASSTDEIMDLYKYAQGRSPICQTIRNAVNLEIKLDDVQTIDNGSQLYTDEDENRHGVSWQGLKDTVQAAQQDADLVKARFYTETRWKGGAKVETLVDKMEMPLGTTHKRDTAHKVAGDEPKELLGENTGPGPSETLLHAMANCVAVTQSYHAGVIGIPVSEFSIDWQGDIDLQGFCDTNDCVHPGYTTIRGKVKACASGKDVETLREFYQKIPDLSPMCDSVRNPVHVTFGLTHNGNVVL